MPDLLRQYGFDDFFAQAAAAYAAEGLIPGRVIAQFRNEMKVATEYGILPAEPSGHYWLHLEERGGQPTVGDFVCLRLSSARDRGVIERLLPRRTFFLRADSWRGGEQILGANFDAVFICMSLNRDFNPTRLERYLLLAADAGARTAVVLTKADLCGDAELQLQIIQAICGDVPVYAVSALEGRGLERLLPYFAPGKTVVALGSSGVGKSTLVNALFGQTIMKTAEVREDDDRGRHTTVHRQLVLLPNGGLYMDTPGLREVGLTKDSASFDQSYADVEELIARCKYADCTHRKEDGCAVRAAIRAGSLDQERFAKYVKMQREIGFQERKAAHKLRLIQQGPPKMHRDKIARKAPIHLE